LTMDSSGAQKRAKEGSTPLKIATPPQQMLWDVESAKL
jgi:hypothetical protein